MDFRRRLLLQALACVGPVACMAPRRAVEPTAPRSHAILTASVPPAVDTLGRHLLQAHPEWFDRDALLRALALSEPPIDERAWLQDLARAVAYEVEAGEWVHLSGWQLTPTECRVYALAVLSV